MASNMAVKRAAKANRRKVVVTEKRKLELSGDSLTARVRRAAGAPIKYCLVPKSMFETGMGAVFLARGAGDGYVSVGVFLVDVWCLGIKDAYFRTCDAEQMKEAVARMDATVPMEVVDPSYARKLLRDAAAWAQSIGFAPHRDFAAVEGLFGNVEAEECTAIFPFGRDGKPLYIAGPTETPAQIRQRMAQLERQLGADNFHFIHRAGEENRTEVVAPKIGA